MTELNLDTFANQYKAEDLIDAVFTSNADPFMIEDEDVANGIYEELIDYGTEVFIITGEDGEEYDYARLILGLEDETVRKIYKLRKYNECASYVAFYNDYK